MRRGSAQLDAQPYVGTFLILSTQGSHEADEANSMTEASRLLSESEYSGHPCLTMIFNWFPSHDMNVSDILNPSGNRKKQRHAAVEEQCGLRG
jgi:hypothetical protein